MARWRVEQASDRTSAGTEIGARSRPTVCRGSGRVADPLLGERELAQHLDRMLGERRRRTADLDLVVGELGEARRRPAGPRPPEA